MIDTTLNTSAIETVHNTSSIAGQPSRFLPHRRITAKTIGLSLLLGFAAVCPAMLLASLFPISWLAQRQFAAVAAAPLAAILTHILLGPLLEEVIYRGLLLQLARRYIPTWAAVVVSSAVFAATHFTGGWGWMVPTFVMGCVFGWLVVRTGSLYSSFLCHAALNFTSGFVVAPMFVLAQKLSAVSAGGKITLTGVFPAWWIVLSFALVAFSVVLLGRGFSKSNSR